jgi:ribonuclease P protein subunit RPR2
MGRKSKDDAPNPNVVANRDILQRLNFLYQASQYLGTLSYTPIASTAPSCEADFSAVETQAIEVSPADKRAPRRKKHATSAADLAAVYVGDMRQVGQKAMMRM